MATPAELRKQITAAAARLTGNLPHRGLTNLRKAELEAELAHYTERLSAARAAGGDYESEALREHGLVYDDESGTWVSADELAQIDEDFESGFADEVEQDFALGDVPELEYDTEVEATNDAAADAEVIEFTEAVTSEASWMAKINQPITETNVQGQDGTALATLVQFGSKLVWGKLIAVVNRKTKYSAPLLVTVEIAGVRRLLSADDVLIGDSFVAA